VRDDSWDVVYAFVGYGDLWAHPTSLTQFSFSRENSRELSDDTTDIALIEREFRSALGRTLFLGVGNPSESGYHLLYYFRQENSLPKTRFAHSNEVFQQKQLSKGQVLKVLRRPNINRYVFIDDFCGSGHQGKEYSKNIVEDIKSLNSAIEVSYFVLFATTTGREYVRKNTAFDVVRCVCELDDTFRCFSPSSRYFPSRSQEIIATFAEQMCRFYGSLLVPDDPLGYDNGQLLIGFHHNTPDNTLPIFWYNEPGGTNWTPIFKRYPKNYG
jgi:hypothetical protein